MSGFLFFYVLVPRVLFLEFFKKYFENTTPPCSLKLHVMHTIFRVRLFAEVCIYGMTYTYIQTDRQTRITFNTSVLGSLRLAPISARVTSLSVLLAPALQPLLEFHFDIAYKGHSHLAKLTTLRSVPLTLGIIA